MDMEEVLKSYLLGKMENKEERKLKVIKRLFYQFSSTSSLP